MIHRNEYMKNSAELHRAYHAQFVTNGIKNLVIRHIGMDAILTSTDKHMNDIPLRKWDHIIAMHDRRNLFTGDYATAIRNGTFIRHINYQQLKDCGECGVSMAFGVCVLKEAAQQLKENVCNP